MADDIQIGIGVDTRQLDKATAGLAKASSAATLAEKNLRAMAQVFNQGFNQDKVLSVFSRLEKAGMAFSGVIKSLAQDQKMAEQSAGDYNNKLMGVDRGFKSAKSSADAFSAALKKQESNVKELKTSLAAQKKAQEDNTASLKSMKMGYDRLYAAEQKTLRLKKLLRTEIANGTMTVRQAGKELLNYRNAQLTSNKVLQQTKNRMNGNNMAIQQLGYQFGDFAVQVQGGTSAFVAFSQQGAQLAGILPMVAGPLGLSMGAAVGLSAALGILIPIGSAVGRMFFEMRDSAEESNAKLSDVAETLQNISAIDLGLGIGKGMLDNATASETKYSSILKMMKEAETIRLREQLQEPLNALKEVYTDYVASVQYAAQLGADAPDFDLLGMKNEAKFIQAFELLSKIQGDTREELQESVLQTKLFLQGSGLLNEEVSKLLLQYADVVGIVEAAGEAQETLTEETDNTTNSNKKLLKFQRDMHEKIADAQKDSLEKTIEGYVAAKDLQSTLEKEVELLRLKKQFGEDSLKVKEQEKANALEAFEAEVRRRS